MSIKREVKNDIKLYILKKIGDEEKKFVKDVADNFGVSRNSIYRYIHEMESDDIIRLNEESQSYEIVTHKKVIELCRSKKELRSEDAIYNTHIKTLLEDLPENVRKIWSYSFSEMLNNAIEHSAAEHVKIIVSHNYMSTSICIIDDGIGIFRKIKEYYDFDTLDDAICELFKGKLTTDSANHSGEGIFFTSRVLDFFCAISDNKIFTHNLFDDKHWNTSELGLNFERGTAISMQLSNFSKKNIADTLNEFSDQESGFSKTRIPINNMFGDFPVSRSQAKRLCNRLESFQEVTLDFKNVSELGQGFSHELFVVFQNKHPDLKINCINVCDAVQRMINHVKPRG